MGIIWMHGDALSYKSRIKGKYVITIRNFSCEIINLDKF